VMLAKDWCTYMERVLSEDFNPQSTPLTTDRTKRNTWDTCDD